MRDCTRPIAWGMSLLIISTSLNPESKSAILAKEAQGAANAWGLESNFLDLRDYDLPLCDGDSAYSHPDLSKISGILSACSGVLLAFPVYTYGAASATKNLFELAGKSIQGKPIGLLAAAGGKNSYMAPLSLANSLMVDYRCPIAPKYVYADGSVFENGTIADGSIKARIVELVKTLDHWAKVL